jgi:hypothetical protein
VPWIRQASAEGEEIPLQPFDHLGQPDVRGLGAAGDESGSCQTEPGIEFVYLAVGCYARIRLRDAGAVEETGFTSIACPGVDFHRERL